MRLYFLSFNLALANLKCLSSHLQHLVLECQYHLSPSLSSLSLQLIILFLRSIFIARRRPRRHHIRDRLHRLLDLGRPLGIVPRRLMQHDRVLPASAACARYHTLWRLGRRAVRVLLDGLRGRHVFVQHPSRHLRAYPFPPLLPMMIMINHDALTDSLPFPSLLPPSLHFTSLHFSLHFWNLSTSQT